MPRNSSITLESAGSFKMAMLLSGMVPSLRHASQRSNNAARAVASGAYPRGSCRDNLALPSPLVEPDRRPAGVAAALLRRLLARGIPHHTGDDLLRVLAVLDRADEPRSTVALVAPVF